MTQRTESVSKKTESKSTPDVLALWIRNSLEKVSTCLHGISGRVPAGGLQRENKSVEIKDASISPYGVVS